MFMNAWFIKVYWWDSERLFPFGEKGWLVKGKDFEKEEMKMLETANELA